MYQCLPIYVYAYTFIYVSLYPSINLSIYLSICLSIYIYIYIYIYLYIYIYIYIYKSILKDCGFNNNIKYCPEESVLSRRRKNHSRNIMRYCPPFRKNVKTNAFKLLKKHFRKNHKKQYKD